jgi:hypothetical protein
VVRSVLGAPRFDTSKPRGLPQQAPLNAGIPEALRASLADQAGRRPGQSHGLPVPRLGHARDDERYGTGIEFVVLPDTTYMMVDDGNDSVRRIFHRRARLPHDFEPTFTGYSIGKWVDTEGRKIRHA